MAVAVAAAFLPSCGVIDFNTLVATIDESGVPTTTTACTNASSGGQITLGKTAETNARRTRIATIGTHLPNQLQSNAVIQAIQSQADYVTAKAASVVSSYSLTTASPAETGVSSAVLSSPQPLNQHDFYDFASLVSETILRQRGGAPSLTGSTIDPYLDMLTQYFQIYYSGKFVTYFGKQLKAPVLSTTIPDQDIDDAATVFLEFLFDEALGTPIWLDSKTYYLGGTTTEPTVATLRYPSSSSPPPDFPNQPNGCGMNLTKAKFITYLAQQFGNAAETDSGLTIKSAGGLEFGLGVLGKLSIGDNSTLTDLVQTTAGEVVLRLTTQFAYLVLNDLPITGSTSAGAGGAMVSLSRRRTQEAAAMQTMNALFKSPNAR